MVMGRAIIMIRGVQVKNVLELQIQVSDEGGKLVSLLSTGNSTVTRMEILGASFFTGMRKVNVMGADVLAYTEERESEINSLLHRMDGNILLVNSTGDVVKTFGSIPSTVKKRFDMEIPLPGGGLTDDGDVRITARMKE